MRSRLIILLWLLACRVALADLAVGKPEWGFDGKVVPDAFNILTVDVRNTGGQPFDGTIGLYGGRFGMRGSAPYQQKVFIAPGSSRAVQFYPYITAGSREFLLAWGGRGEGKVPVDSPDAGPPAVVLLADFDAPNLRSIRMRAFNEANFPPTASATDGLHAVVVDHQPRWDPVRREAFLDCLKRGGLVHVINGPDGATPEFAGELAVLNDPAPRFSVGAGLVVRHTISRAEITDEFLKGAGFPPPQFSKDGQGAYNEGDGGIFRQLGTVTKPDIAWGLIYLLTFVYVGLVGPAFYFLRKRDHRLLIGGFVATVALFAWIFTIVGRRGYGEKQVYHCVALARSIEGTKWDVRHWVHAFATSGDTYRFTMPGVSQLYSPFDEADAVRGEVIQGREASFSADIPLFSSRPFLHQGVMNGPDPGWEVAELEVGPGKSSLRKLRITQRNALEGKLLTVSAQYGDAFYNLSEGKNEWIMVGNKHTFANAFGGPDNNYTFYGNSGESPAVTLDRLRKGSSRLARRIATGDASHVPLARPPEEGYVRLFAYANAPQAFPLESSDFLPGHTFVLFVQDLAPRPQTNP